MIFRETSYGTWNHGIYNLDHFHSIGNKHITIFDDILTEHRVCNWDTMLESHRRLKKTVYGDEKKC